MSINQRAIYFYDSNKKLTKEGKLTFNETTGVYTYVNEDVNINAGDIGTTRLAVALPLGTYTDGSPYVHFLTQQGYKSGLLLMNTQTWTIDEDGVETQYQVFYKDLMEVGWTYKEGRHSFIVGYLASDGETTTFDKLDPAFYIVSDGINNYEELNADEYEQIYNAIQTSFTYLANRLVNNEDFLTNAFSYNKTANELLKGINLYNSAGDSVAVLTHNGTDFVLTINGQGSNVLTDLNNINDLANVIETAIADDDILIRSGANYVNVSKADFLQAVTDRLTTNEQDITTLGNEKEDKSNKIITWGTPTNTQYPSAKLVHDNLKTLFKAVTYNSTNGVMTFTKFDDTTTTIDLPLELIIESGSYDEVGNDLVFVLANGNEIRVPVDNLLTDLDAENIRYNNTESGLTATKIKGAIDELQSKKIDKDFSNYNLEVELSLDDEIIVRDVSTNQTKKTTLDYLNFVGQSIIEYGVRFNVSASSPTGERVKKVNGIMTVDGETNATDLHSSPAASINGVGSNSFDSIFRTSLVEEFNVNGDGNTFARIQPYFLKQELVNDGTNTYLYYWACLTKLDGYRTPLPFLQADGSVSYYDIGHEEGVVDANGRLRSITDEDFPTVDINRGAFRTAARKNDGVGTNTDSKYQITDIAEYNDLIQIPMMIEFATKNLQSIFRGHVDSTYDADTVADGASVEGASTAIVSNADGANFPIGQGVYVSTDSKLHTITNIEVDKPIAGQTTITFDGDAVAILTGANLDPRQWNTGNFKNAKYHSCYYSSSIANGKQPFMWRFIVNPYGNQWKFVDGVKIVDWQVWIATDPADYDDAGSAAGEYASPFIKLDYVRPQSNGYIKELGFDARYPFAQLPVDNGGSSNTYYSDYYYQNSGDRVSLVGGFWYYTSAAGPFCWYLDYSLAVAGSHIGARLSKRP